MEALKFWWILLLYAALAEASDYSKLCRLFKKETQIRVPGSCDQYIICSGGNSKILNCTDNAKYDAKQQKCIANLDTTALCENRCIDAKDGTFAANPTNCRAYYYCENQQPAESVCGIEFLFHYEKQQCVYPQNSQCIQNINNICELVADKTLFRDENDCSKYFRCDKNKLTKLDCKTLYFDVETGKCAARTAVSCAVRRGTASTCLKGKTPFVGLKTDGETCRGYFICANKGAYAHDLAPVWYHCPAGEFFVADQQTCLPAIDVKCNYNRCDGRGNSTVVSGKNNCRNYLQCENDKIIKEVTCDYDYFFDERSGTCVPHVIYDNGCDDETTHS